jgi:hypothetical protein
MQHLAQGLTTDAEVELLVHPLYQAMQRPARDRRECLGARHPRLGDHLRRLQDQASERLLGRRAKGGGPRVPKRERLLDQS